jgi:hypothetical protein
MRSIQAKYIFFLSAFLLCLFSMTMAQEVEEVPMKDLSNGTIEEQFDYINSKSKTQDDFKVVSKLRLSTIESNILDTIKGYRKELAEVQQTLSNQIEENTRLKSELETAQVSISKASKEKNSIGLFGIQMKKGVFKTIMWSIIVVLGLLLTLFIMRFISSNSVTLQSKKRYDEIYEEFEDYKHKSIENEQVLRRKLQDEINKRL